MSTHVLLKRRIIAFTLIICCFFGEILFIPNFKIFGIVPTVFRILVPFIFVYLCANEVHKNQTLFFSKSELLFIIVLLSWLCWGVCSILISPYAELNRGLKELLSVFYGLIIVLNICILTRNNAIPSILDAIKFSVILLILLGIIELFTGLHLDISRASNPVYNYSIIPGTHYYYGPKMEMATGIFYNENDFSACLATFSPLFFTIRQKTKSFLKKTLDILTLSAILLLLKINDADIAIIALLLSFVFYLIFSFDKKKKFTKKTLIVILFIIASFPLVFKFINKIFASILFKLNNATTTTSTVHIRILTYKRAVDAWISTNGLGVGAGGFSNYFSEFYKDNYVINPHSLWFEILSEYGTIIFAVFLLIYIIIVIKLLLLYKSTRNDHLLIIATFMVSMSIACFAPSTFLGYSYIWIIIGLGISQIIDHKINKANLNSNLQACIGG